MSGFSQESLAALVETYTLQELKAKRKEVADKLLELDMITSASGGGWQQLQPAATYRSGKPPGRPEYGDQGKNGAISESGPKRYHCRI